ncbi:hypothetical protein BaRGS_00026776 [Batillaria attramentaria]|uniref:Alkaline phosphatase, tissue-nonspecific isozyme n=1 Tax=Batillaria attramentaria TaxID=370345 RepID=A0ABD0K4S7_9CAEN
MAARGALVLCMCFGVATVHSAGVPPSERNPKFWNDKAKEEIVNAMKDKDVVGVAKNVILFLGDGMGVTTVTAGRILQGQMKGGNGEDNKLSFDHFPNVALSKTYNVDHQTPDSAGTGTAYLCGVKTNMGVIGVDAHSTKGNCASSQDREVYSIRKWSRDAGKSTGVVTTTRVTHATPAATYAHTPHRDWEGSVPDGQQPCTDIAHQLVHDNDIEVVMGGGRQMFIPVNTTDEEGGESKRQDGRDLIGEWVNKVAAKTGNFQYVWNNTQFMDVDPDKTEYLLALFNPSHMEYEVDRPADKAGEPSLAEMTRKAIQILQKNEKGFFLLVEGGRIDHGHHMNQAAMALHDTVAFSDAVQVAADMMDLSDTLIVVTADHSHAFAFAGYPGRGNPILDGMPYTTMVYGNGPGHTGEITGNNTRQNLTLVNTTDPNYKQQAVVPLTIETHGGEDVAIFARGPMAHLFHGVHEQNYIAHVMAYASCVGAYSDANECAASLQTGASTGGAAGGSGGRQSVWLSFLVGLWCVMLLLIRD